MNSPAIERRGFLLVLSSPSGAGKTTITRRLVAGDPGLTLSVSVTTRPPRDGEVDGRDYSFIDRHHFDEMLAQGEFLEHATALTAGHDVVGDVDWQGTQQLAKSVPRDLVSVFVLPPSLAALDARLRARAQDSAATVAARMAESAEEMGHWPEYDYVIVNRKVEESVAQVRAIVTAERLRRVRQTGLAEFVDGVRAG